MCIWQDLRFLALDRSGREVWKHLLIGPQTQSLPGLFQIGPGRLSDELLMSRDEAIAGLRAVLAAGLAFYDETTQLVWLPNAVKHNPPASPNVIAAWGKALEHLPDCELLRFSLGKIRENLCANFRNKFDEMLTASGMKTQKRQPKSAENPSYRDQRSEIREQRTENTLGASPLVSCKGSELRSSLVGLASSPTGREPAAPGESPQVTRTAGDEGSPSGPSAEVTFEAPIGPEVSQNAPHDEGAAETRFTAREGASSPGNTKTLGSAERRLPGAEYRPQVHLEENYGPSDSDAARKVSDPGSASGCGVEASPDPALLPRVHGGQSSRGQALHGAALPAVPEPHGQPGGAARGRPRGQLALVAGPEGVAEDPQSEAQGVRAVTPVEVDGVVSVVPSSSGRRGLGRQDRSDEVRAVFDRYREYHPRAHRNPKSSSKEWKRIVDRLGEGYSVQDLCDAIDGMHRTPHNLGMNERNQQYLALELCMRTGDHVTRFGEARARDPTRYKSAATAKMDFDLDEWVRRKQGKGVT